MARPPAPRGSVFALSGSRRVRGTPSLASSLRGAGALATSEQVSVSSIGGDGGRSGYFSPRSGRRAQSNCTAGAAGGIDRQRDHLDAGCCPSPAAGMKAVAGDRHRRTFDSSSAVGGVDTIGGGSSQAGPADGGRAMADGRAGADAKQEAVAAEPAPAATSAPTAIDATPPAVAPVPRTSGRAAMAMQSATRRNLGASFGGEGVTAPEAAAAAVVRPEEPPTRRAPSSMVGDAMAAASAAAAAVASSPRAAITRRSNAWMESPATPLSFSDPPTAPVARVLAPAPQPMAPQPAAPQPEAPQPEAPQREAPPPAVATSPSRRSCAWMETAAAPLQFSPATAHRYAVASGLHPAEASSAADSTTAPPLLPPVQRSDEVASSSPAPAATNLLSQSELQAKRAEEAMATAAKNAHLAAQREAVRSKARSDELEDGRARAQYAVGVKASADAVAAQLRAARIAQAKADAAKFEAQSNTAYQQRAQKRATVSAHRAPSTPRWNPFPRFSSKRSSPELLPSPPCLTTALFRSPSRSAARNLRP